MLMMLLMLLKIVGTSVGGIVAGIVVAVAVIAVTVAVVVVLLKRRKNTKKQAETYLPSYKDVCQRAFFCLSVFHYFFVWLQSGESNPNSIIIHTNTPTSSPTSNNNEDIYHNTNNSNNTKGDDNSSSTELPAVSSSSFSSSNYNDSNSRAAARKQNREEEQSVYDTMPRTKSMAFLLGAFQVKKASGESAGGVELPRVDGEETTTKATGKCYHCHIYCFNNFVSDHYCHCQHCHFFSLAFIMSCGCECQYSILLF